MADYTKLLDHYLYDLSEDCDLIAEAIATLENLFDHRNRQELMYFSRPTAVAYLALKKVQKLPKEQKWIPAKDKMPTPGDGFGTWYIICNKRGEVFPLRYVTKKIRGKRVERWEWEYGNIYYGEVVAWMPLPKPYTAENNAVITQGGETNG